VVSAAPTALAAQYRANLRVGISAPSVSPRAPRVESAQRTSRGGASWKGPVLAGAALGLLAGIWVASRPGDEGGKRTVGDRLSSGLVAGAIVAVPVTVIVAIVSPPKPDSQ